VAILGDTLFMGTLDAHLIAIDAKSGRPLWNVALADMKLAYSITLAPLVVKDKVIVDVGGGEFGIREFIAALDARTGKGSSTAISAPATRPAVEAPVGSGLGEDGQETLVKAYARTHQFPGAETAMRLIGKRFRSLVRSHQRGTAAIGAFSVLVGPQVRQPQTRRLELVGHENGGRGSIAAHL
jgi:hypothetical protein